MINLTFKEFMIGAGFLATALISFEIGVTVATESLIDTYGDLPKIEAKCEKASKLAIECRDKECQNVANVGAATLKQFDENVPFSVCSCSNCKCEN